MAKKQKNTRSDRSYNVHDHRADELAFDLMSTARDIAFDVVTRDNGIITLHAHPSAPSNTDSIVVIVTATDYIIGGEHVENATLVLDAINTIATAHR